MMKKYLTGIALPVCMLFIAIQTNGQIPQWVNQFNAISTGTLETGQTGMVCDQAGTCYVLGYSADTAFNYTGYLIKYDADGIQHWVEHIPDIGYASYLAIDNAGFVYVAAALLTSVTGKDFLTIKFDPSGTFIWSAQFDGAAHLNDEPRFITVDHLQNVYVSGAIQTAAADMDIATIKYDPAGNLLWSSILEIADDFPYAGQVAVDGNHHCYVTCWSHDGVNGSSVLMRIDSSGNLSWLKRYDAGGGYAPLLNIFQDRFIYVVGSGSFSNEESDYLCIKYDSSGNELWASTYDAQVGTGDDVWETPSASKNDKEGNIIITGRQAIPFGAQTLLTVKFDTLGSLVWKNEYDGSAEEYDLGNSIAIGSDGNVFVCGETIQGIDYNHDLVVLVYNSDGVTLDSILFQPSLTDYSQGRSICLDASDNIYVSGNYYNSNESGFVTIKYNTITGINEKYVSESSVSVFPNPVAAQLTINFPTSSGVRSDIAIHVYDLQGRIYHCELKNESGWNNSIQMNTADLPNGFYTLRIIDKEARICEVKNFVKVE